MILLIELLSCVFLLFLGAVCIDWAHARWWLAYQLADKVSPATFYGMRAVAALGFLAGIYNLLFGMLKLWYITYEVLIL